MIVSELAGIESKVILARDNTPLLEMVKIPAGEFLMGSADSDSSAYDDEKPQKRIHLEDYWISRTPVTNRMWQKFLQESGYNPLQEDHDGNFLYHWSGQNPPDEKLDHPVVYVSSINARAFCDFYGLMLPCEAQWEKAARGTDGRIYPWGNEAPTKDLCNFNGAGTSGTTPVGQYPRGMSVYGLLDCAGNVREWCEEENAYSVSCRGGSFGNVARSARCAYRRNYSPRVCLDFIGFRPAQDNKKSGK